MRFRVRIAARLLLACAMTSGLVNLLAAANRVPVGQNSTAGPSFFGIMGEVGRPGVYQMSARWPALATLLKAAGGLTARASGNLRIVRDGRIAFITSVGTGAATKLMPGDLVIADAQSARTGGAQRWAAGAGVWTPSVARPPVQLAFVNLLPRRPVVVKVAGERATVQQIVADLGQSSEIVPTVRVLLTNRRASSQPLRDAYLPNGTVLVFNPRLIDISRLPPFPKPYVVEGPARRPARSVPAPYVRSRDRLKTPSSLPLQPLRPALVHPPAMLSAAPSAPRVDIGEGSAGAPGLPKSSLPSRTGTTPDHPVIATPGNGRDEKPSSSVDKTFSSNGSASEKASARPAPPAGATSAPAAADTANPAVTAERSDGTKPNAHAPASPRDRLASDRRNAPKADRAAPTANRSVVVRPSVAAPESTWPAAPRSSKTSETKFSQTGPQSLRSDRGPSWTPFAVAVIGLAAVAAAFALLWSMAHSVAMRPIERAEQRPSRLLEALLAGELPLVEEPLPLPRGLKLHGRPKKRPRRLRLDDAHPQPPSSRMKARPETVSVPRKVSGQESAGDAEDDGIREMVGDEVPETTASSSAPVASTAFSGHALRGPHFRSQPVASHSDQSTQTPPTGGPPTRSDQITRPGVVDRALLAVEGGKQR
ncbi:MAG: hypothetical protein GXP27_13310 [Planctomycetes bacterium]|nr:hypothetical protein [Planctomycetota bacterium]